MPEFKVPDMPELKAPDMPKFTVPDMPKFSMPKMDSFEMPKIDAPKFDLPTKIDSPKFEMPKSPEIPAFKAPEIPAFKKPDMPKIDMPAFSMPDTSKLNLPKFSMPKVDMPKMPEYDVQTGSSSVPSFSAPSLPSFGGGSPSSTSVDGVYIEPQEVRDERAREGRQVYLQADKEAKVRLLLLIAFVYIFKSFCHVCVFSRCASVWDTSKYKS